MRVPADACNLSQKEGARLRWLILLPGDALVQTGCAGLGPRRPHQMPNYERFPSSFIHRQGCANGVAIWLSVCFNPVMAIFSSASTTAGAALRPDGNKRGGAGVRAAQVLAKQKSLEKKAKKYKLPLGELTMFTQQLASLLVAGLPLVQCLEALQDQTEEDVYKRQPSRIELICFIYFDGSPPHPCPVLRRNRILRCSISGPRADCASRGSAPGGTRRGRRGRCGAR